MRFDLAEVARATDGELVGANAVVSGASIDSRSLQPGALFVPIVAERDGHDFIDAAVAAGAAAHLTHRRTTLSPAVHVDNTTLALQGLGAAARDRVIGDVVGVTGSVGKTTTKDMLRSALHTSRRVHASYRSFNNELGVPLTLIEAPDDVEVVVCEMGARGQGHIADLCKIARPTVGVVLAVGAAHTEPFGDVDGVARAKGELVEALAGSGTAVLNAQDHRVAAMAGRTEATVVTFGLGGDVRADNVSLDQQLRPSFRLGSPWGSAECTLPTTGLHNVTNALAAATVALVLGVDPEAVAEGLASAEISPWRMEVTTNAVGALVINDSYNANPMSMHAAIDALLAVSARRRVAVVGVMAELGERHHQEHRAVGERLADAGVEVISVSVPEYGGILVHTAQEAAQALGQLREGDAVLIKASRVAGLEHLAADMA